MTAIDERALAAIIAPELEKSEAVMTDPMTLRRLKAERIARAVLQALSPGSTGETEGWVLVPKEPTPGMRVAGRDALRSLFDSSPCEADAADTYRAMLAAAGGRDE